MNISRNFLVIASIYILIGMILGSYMGGSGDRTLAPLHAHMNLLGFVLPAIFALVYRSYPAMAESPLSKPHFWLHQIGVLILLVFLYLELSRTIGEGSPATLLAPISEGLIIIATGLFAWNVYRNAN
jgi:hypothetical protein